MKLLSPPLRHIQHDERGITLQTLIVTTVLVLMAVAAGVVIMAITNQAQQQFEGAGTNNDSACEPWEVRNVGLEAAGRGGPNAQGGIESSAIGCRRVCYVRLRNNTTSLTTPPNDINLNGTLGVYDASNPQADLYFSRSDALDRTGHGSDAALQVVSYPVAGKKSVDPDGNTKGGTLVAIKKFKGVDWPDTHSIRVNARGDACIVIDSSQTSENRREVLRSN